MDTVDHHFDRDASIFVLESGGQSDTLVVLIHGSLDRSTGMARLAKLISDRSAVLRYDRRGYGRSWPHRGPFAVSDQVDDLQSILGRRPAILIGHSFGGNVALAAAARMGEQIVGVSTYETPLSWLPWWPSTTAGAVGVDSGPELAAERFLTRLVGEETWRALPERTKDARRREGVALVGELAALRAGAPWEPSDVRCPVRCGIGSLARGHHRRAAEWMTENVPTAKTFVLAGAGHGAHNSHPEPFCEALVYPHLL